MQIDQDPGAYRVKGPDGVWRYRVNKPLCRIGGLVFLAFAALFALQLEHSISALYVGGMMFCAGILIALSLKSTDW